MAKGPPNALMQSYEALDDASKLFFRKVGMFLVVLSAVTPMIAGIWYEFEMAWWAMCATIFTVGICMVWPPLAIWAVMAIPTALAKVMPSKKLADTILPDRRTEERDETWTEAERAERLEEAL